jgi:TP901 family phage tail tape measure protein
MGADTKFSAGEAAAAMYELSSAGFSVRETSKALPGTLSLAAASNIDLASASEIAANALNGFGLRSGRVIHVADVLAQSVNSSSVEMRDLQLSLKYIGPVAKATGQDFEEMIAAVSVMGDAGIKGEQAGTTLRAGLIRLVKPTKMAREGLAAMGLSAEELQGPNGLLPLPELVGKLQEGTEGLSKAERAQALAAVFGNEALSGMLAIVDSGPRRLARLTREFENSDGASAKAARTMQDNVAGAWEQLTGSIETVEIALYDHFRKPLKEVLLDATQMVNTQGREIEDFFDDVVKTPEFKQGDLGEKIGAIFDELDKRGAGDTISDMITRGIERGFEAGVPVVTRSIPIVAEAVGKSAGQVALSFTEGFLESDALGKLVMGAWFIKALGGWESFRYLGGRAGATTGAAIAASTAATTEQAITRGPFRARVGGALRRVGGAIGPTAGIILGASIIGAAMKTIGNVRDMPGGTSAAEAGLNDFVINWGRQFGLDLGDTASEQITKKINENVGSFFRSGQSILGEGFREGIMADPEGWAALAPSEQDVLRLANVTGRRLRRAFHAEGQRIGREDLLGFQGLFKKDPEGFSELIRTWTRDMRILRSGTLNGWGDIQDVLKRSNRAIQRNPDMSGERSRRVISLNYRAARDAVVEAWRDQEISTKQKSRLIRQLTVREMEIVGDQPARLARRWADGWGRVENITEGNLDRMVKHMERMPPRAQRIFGQTLIDSARELDRKGKLPTAAVERLVSKLAKRYGILPDKVRPTNREVAGSTGGLFQSLNQAVGGVFTDIFGNVKGALSGLGVDDSANFTAKVRPHPVRERYTPLATGGVMEVPGQGLQDTVPMAVNGAVQAVVAPQEKVVVFNRHQWPEAQARFADVGGLQGFFKQRRRPHYMAGGGVMGSYPGVSGDTDFDPRLGNALSAMARQKGTHISVAEGFRTRAEQQYYWDLYQSGQGNLAARPGTSNHEQGLGMAADISPGREVFGGIADKFGLGFTVPSESWHVELVNAAAAGVVGGAAQKIARQILQGPSPLREVGQEAIDKVTKAANTYIAKQAPRVPAGGGLGGIPSSIRGLGSGSAADNRALGLKLMHAKYPEWSGQFGFIDYLWGVGESAWDEEADNPTSTAYGIPQNIDPATYPPAGRPGAPSGGKKAAAQILWGYDYIKNRPGYGTPEAALAFWRAQSPHWYKLGGILPSLSAGGIGDVSGDGNPFDPRQMRGRKVAPPKAGKAGYKPRTIDRLTAKANLISSQFQGYVLGGGHGQHPVTDNRLDCSGAVAKLMQQSGWPEFRSAHSSEYESRFNAGAGEFTIWSNGGHTFVEFPDGKEWGTYSGGLDFHQHGHGGFTPRHPKLGGGGGGGEGGGGRKPKVLLIGDSLAASTKGWPGDWIVDAKVGRGTTAGLEVLKDRLDKNVGRVVFDLATNDRGNPGLIRENYKKAKNLAGKRQLTFVETYFRDQDPAAVNRAIRGSAESLKANLIPWYAVASQHPEWSTGGYHLTEKGEQKRKQMIVGDVTEGLSDEATAKQRQARARKEKRESDLQRLTRVAKRTTNPEKQLSAWWDVMRHYAQFADWIRPGEKGRGDYGDGVGFLGDVRDARYSGRGDYFLDQVGDAAGYLNPLRSIAELRETAAKLEDRDIDMSGQPSLSARESLIDEFKRKTRRARRQMRRRRGLVFSRVRGAGLVPGLRERITDQHGRLEDLNEKITGTETLATLDASPGGSEYSADEIADLKTLWTRNLQMLYKRSGLLYAAKNFLEDQIRVASEKIQLATPQRAPDHWMLPAFRQNRNAARTSLTEDIIPALEEVVGRGTGFGGAIFDAQIRLSELGSQASASSTQQPGDIEELRAIIEATKAGAFDHRPAPPQYAGIYHTGGIVNDERTITAKVGEGVFTEEQMEAMGAELSSRDGLTEIKVENKVIWNEFGALIETSVNDVIFKREQHQLLADRAGVHS